MTVRPSRGPVAALALLATTALAVAGPVASAAPPVGGPLPTDVRTVVDPAVDVGLTRLEPVSVRPGQRLRVGGDIVSDQPLRGVTVQLEVGTTAFETRTSVTEAAQPTDPGTAASTTATVPVPGATDRVGAVPTGRASFLVRVPTTLLPVGGSGVYPLRVRVTAVRDGVTSTVATVDTFLPWSPRDEGVRPTRLLWFWPLVDQPHRDSEGRFVDTALAGELAPAGRLSTLTAAATGRQVTWLVDPALLSDASALATPSRTAADPAQAVAPSTDARRWLASLPAATAAGDVVSLPYADPDLVAVARADRPGLLVAAQRTGGRTTRAVLGRPARTDLAWPADGFADDDTLRTVATCCSTSVLLSADAVPLVDPPAWTPSGRVDLVDEQLAGVLTDPTLDAVVAEPVVGSSSVLLARQLFLAQTLLITMELPSDPRLVSVVPPRRWDPDPLWAATLLDATDRASWLKPLSLDEALSRRAPVIPREAPQLPASVARQTLPRPLVEGAGVARRGLATYRAILTDRRPATAYNQALLGTVSTAWRGAPDEGVRRLDETVSRLDADRDKVRIVSGDATLSAESAPLPVTVRNELDQPVRLRLAVQSSDPLRLRVTVPDSLLTVDAGGTKSVSVQLDAVTSGRLAVEATLLTPAGRAYSAPVTIPVDVRAYGRVALIVFGLAAALLVLAAATRVARRIRRARADAGGS